MSNQSKCQSCGMPVESGPYCPHCTDQSGALQSFDERVARMSQFLKRQTPNLSDDAARTRSVEYMSTMPAWQHHPEVKKALSVK